MFALNNAGVLFLLEVLNYVHMDCDAYSFRHDKICIYPRSRKHAFHNVLGVEWDEGIAYRKVLGRVGRKSVMGLQQKSSL